MKVEIRITVSADDGSSPRAATSALLLATGLEGVDAATAKQDFLTQAEGLVRTVAESQLPALYQASLDAQAMAAAAKAEEATKSNAVAAARVKLSKLRQRKGQEAGQASGTSEAGPEAEAAAVSQGDMVTCTGCGKVISHDDAHYVSIVKDGKYDHDGVLCDACYDNEMRETHKAARDALGPADGGLGPADGGAQ